MADAWGGSWGAAWGVSWGSGVTPPTPAQTFTGSGRSATQYRAKTLSREAREREVERSKKRIVRELATEGYAEPNAGLLSLIETGLADAIIADADLTRESWKQDHLRIERTILLAAINAAIDEEEAVLLLLAAT